jgi:signal transduction histidine kinase
MPISFLSSRVGQIGRMPRIAAVPDYLRSSTFGLTATFAVMFAASAALLFAFIFWQTATLETGRIDRFIAHDAALIAAEPPEAMSRAVADRALADLHRITFAGLFDADGAPIAGNLEALPLNLPIDGVAHRIAGSEIGGDTDPGGIVEAVGRRLPNGGALVLGRDLDSVAELRAVVLRALGMGVAPALILSLVAGAYVSRRARERVAAVQRAAERIMQGDLRERLPARGSGDDFDRLAGSVNLMLDEIGRLLDSVRAAGDDIAQHLRAPLQQIRARLEQAPDRAMSREALQAEIDRAIGDLDRTLGIATTLLRIGEIQSGRRRRDFETMDLSVVLDDLAQIYGPLAEERLLRIETSIEPGLRVQGDPGLLMEALANLLQNAINFTPPGGRIALEATGRHGMPLIRVADTGPGIPAEVRETIFKRFCRLDRDRHIEGQGLGLSLAAAVAKLHGFDIRAADTAEGAAFELLCYEGSRRDAADGVRGEQ